MAIGDNLLLAILKKNCPFSEYSILQLCNVQIILELLQPSSLQVCYWDWGAVNESYCVRLSLSSRLADLMVVTILE